ncbi:phosphoribosyltransferase family protein [uncultured Microbulbifer sp.]|uniref:phosphoribosyltransferase family protein n=1 Tax=uncultured Microbulbifer sp. TaxID=348147 RepID=UPI0025FBEE93|nr:phosphoribosyltransferase family protein [uncultured Microbulbifer sp.]
MQFVNYQQMSLALQENRRKLPKKIDLVVGIPRSGMIPATMLATQLNLPLTDIDGLKAGRLLGFGDTKKTPDIEAAHAADRTVLVIDDAVGSGRAFKKARKDLEGVEGHVVFCAVFAPVAKHPDVDVVLEKLASTLVAPWNLLHSSVLRNACVDIDEVFCRNPVAYEYDNDEVYRRFLLEAEQLHASSGEIGWLITSRRETYRPETEAWLEKYGVKYRELIMTQSDEEHANSPAFKARVYQETGAGLFIESDAAVAAEIFALSKRPVVCIETQSVVSGSNQVDTGGKMVARTSMGLAKLKLQLRNLIGDNAYYAIKSIAGRG